MMNSLHSTETQINSSKMQIAVIMKNIRPKSFEYGFQPIYYFSRVIGLWPFTIVRDSNGSIEKTRVRFVDAFWFFISIFAYLTAAFYAYKDIKSLQVSNTETTNFSIFFIFQIMCLLFGACGVVLDMCNRTKLVNILEKFTAFDNEVGFSIYSISFSRSSFGFCFAK